MFSSSRTFYSLRETLLPVSRKRPHPARKPVSFMLVQHYNNYRRGRFSVGRGHLVFQCWPLFFNDGKSSSANHTIVDTNVWEKRKLRPRPCVKNGLPELPGEQNYVFWFFNCVKENGFLHFAQSLKSSWTRLNFCYLGFCHHAVKGAGEHCDFSIFNWCDVSLCLLLKDHAMKHGRSCHSTTLKI